VLRLPPRPPFTPAKSRYPLFRRPGGPQGRSGRVRKIPPPPRFDHRTVQPAASRYTDWAIPALLLISKGDDPSPTHKSLLYFKVHWIHTRNQFATQITVIVEEWTFATDKIGSEENFSCASCSRLILGWQLEEFEVFRFCLIACQLHAPVSHVTDVVQTGCVGNTSQKQTIQNYDCQSSLKGLYGRLKHRGEIILKWIICVL
jgi:hypothetical protein